MKLSDWLQTNKRTLASFAKDIGVANASVVAKYANGHRIPKPEIMRKIEVATGSQVTANDFYPAEAAA